jgi:hypothetical protein
MRRCILYFNDGTYGTRVVTCRSFLRQFSRGTMQLQHNLPSKIEYIQADYVLSSHMTTVQIENSNSTAVCSILQ